MEDSEPVTLVKENVVRRGVLAARWVAAALAAAAAALALAAAADRALPAPLPRGAPPQRFSAAAAHDHLLNLTAIGPRVAGSYENEVLAVAAVVAAVKRIARDASPHNRVELDVHTSSGAFSLTFMDGMNNVYRDVSSVVARVSGAGGRARPAPARSALLLNCHIDTVPDSPGASDDGAGCAVLLETLRALAAAPRPLRHDAIFLFNGAEENIMQASHGFITAHRWASSVRAFINIEACGAGGREVLFQAGPGDPWIVETYASSVPHPFASSLAQELFQSGLIPADTDFRIFRDFGRVSGVDLAWAANGYVYHTRLDTADRVPLGSLQRTGDNVLALAHALLASDRLGSPPEQAARQPVFFDVLGLWVVTARPAAAAAAALAALAALAFHLHITARRAQAELYLPYGAWLRAVARACGAVCAALAAGVAAAVAVALALAAAGARLSWYARPALLAPLYAAPALAGAWAALRAATRGGGAAARGWWRARAVHGALALLAGGAVAACLAAGLRSGFLPLLWAVPSAAADAACGRRARGGVRAAAWAAAAAPAALQTSYLALGSLRTLVPLAGRAGAGAVPADAAAAALVAALALLATAWLLPLVAAARRVRPLLAALAAACACGCALVCLTPLGAPYSAECPQRVMIFHTRRTVHAPHPHEADEKSENYFWIPDLDDNTPHSLAAFAPLLAAARRTPAAECSRWAWCGAPYYLPVASLVPRAHAAPARSAPRVRLRANVSAARLAGGERELTLEAAGAAHLVALVAAAPGARLVSSSAVAAPLEARHRWGERRLYFFALHAARAPAAPWRLVLRVADAPPGQPAAQVAVAAHALFGGERLAAEHARLLAALPATTAPTGWGVDLHIYTV